MLNKTINRYRKMIKKELIMFIKDLFRPSPFDLVREGRIEEFKNRLDEGLSPDQIVGKRWSIAGYSFFEYAMQKQDFKLVILLLTYGANRNKSDEGGEIKFSVFAVNNFDFSLARILLLNGFEFRGAEDLFGNSMKPTIKKLVDWCEKEVQKKEYQSNLRILEQEAKAELEEGELDSAQKKFETIRTTLETIYQQELKRNRKSERSQEMWTICRSYYETKIEQMNQFLEQINPRNDRPLLKMGNKKED